MRKIFIILTLIVSSFFVFKPNVKADTVSYNVNSSHLNYINDDFYLIREKAIEYCNENNKHYVIIYESEFIAYVFDTDYAFVGYNNPIIYFKVDYTAEKYKIRSGVFTLSGSATSITSSLVPTSSSTSINLNYYIDTNLENVLYTGSKEFNIVYNDLIYPIKKDTVVPTLYQIYLDENYVEPEPEPEDPHLEEKEILSNFYTTVITKIGELANNVFNNYILLFSIGIFIFVFVFEIIFRRLL